MGYGQVVYDGFGNPVGLFPGLPQLIQRLLNRGQNAPPPPPAIAPMFRPFRRFAPPVGWVTPALPYTGMQPRRVYLRCSAWPGPAGMVPAHALQPGQPGAPGTPGAPGSGRGGRRRRRMRRRR